MMITKAQVEHLKNLTIDEWAGGAGAGHKTQAALSALIAVGERLALGTHVLVSKADADKIWMYDDLCK